MKESIKRTSRWAAKYHTHDRSYYPVSQSAVPLSAVATIAPLQSEGITPWLERYRPVRQRTVRSETTSFPPAVYAVQPTGNESEGRLPFPEEIDIIRSANSVPQPFVSIQFVDDGDVSEIFEDNREVQIDEYETDSDDDETENEEHLELVKRACITRSGRAVRAFVRLDL